MTSEWIEVSVGDVTIQVTKGTTPTTIGFSFENDGVRFIKVESLSEDGRFLEGKFAYISDDTHNLLLRSQLQEDDVLFTIAGTIGRTAIVDAKYLPANTNQAVAIVRPDKTKVSPRFLRYVLSNRSFTVSAKNKTVQSVQANYSLGELKKARFYLPTLDGQNEILSVLSPIDDRITLLRETNSTLEAIAKALFKSWFVDFDPVRAKAEGRVPDGIDEATAALFPNAFEESELGLIPRGWQVDAFENCLAVLETGRRPKGGVGGIESGIPSIGAESITKIGDFDYSKLKYVSAEFFETMKSGKLESRDVLLYKDGGKPGVFLPRVSMFGEGFPFEICGINEHVFRIRAKAPLGQTFLYFWLWSDSVMHELKHRGGKAAIPGINQKDVKELKIAVPCQRVLTQFDTVTSPLISQIFSNSKSIKVLIDLRDTLLPRLISGQLRIADAETELEKAMA